MEKTTSVEKREISGFRRTIPRVLTAAALAVSFAMPAKAIASNAPLFDSTPAAAKAWATNPMFIDYGKDGLSGAEKNARDNMFWLSNNTTDSAQTNSIVKRYFEAKGVNNRSLLLLGNILDEIKSKKGEYHLVTPSELALYMLYEKGDTTRLRYVPRSPLIVMIGLEDLQTTYCTGSPTDGALTQTTAAASQTYSWESGKTEAAKPVTETKAAAVAPESTAAPIVYPGPYQLRNDVPKPKQDTAVPKPQATATSVPAKPTPAATAAQKPVAQSNQAVFAVNEQTIRDLYADYERHMRKAYNEQVRLIKKGDSLQSKLNSINKAAKHKHKKQAGTIAAPRQHRPAGSIAAVKPLEQPKEKPGLSFWANAKHIFKSGMDKLGKAYLTTSEMVTSAPQKVFAAPGKAYAVAWIAMVVAIPTGIFLLASSMSRKFSSKGRKKRALKEAMDLLLSNSTSMKRPRLEFGSITGRALELARKRSDVVRAQIFLRSIKRKLEKGFAITEPDMIDFSARISAVGMKHTPKRRAAAPKKSGAKKRARRLVSQLPGL